MLEGHLFLGAAGAAGASDELVDTYIISSVRKGGGGFPGFSVLG